MLVRIQKRRELISIQTHTHHRHLLMGLSVYTPADIYLMDVMQFY